LIVAAKKGARTATVAVVFVLGLERKGKVGSVLVTESVERDALDEGAVRQRNVTSVGAHCEKVMIQSG
jgi:hypothetical protein